MDSGGRGVYEQRSYGSVSLVSRTLWSFRKFFRSSKGKVEKMSTKKKVRIAFYVLFFLVNVLWLGSTLTGMRSDSDSEPAPRSGRGRGGRSSFDPTYSASNTVWGNTPTRRHGHDSVPKQTQRGNGAYSASKDRGRGGGNRNSREASTAHMDASGSHESDKENGSIDLSDDTIRSSGEHISIDAKKVFINTRKDADSDLVIRGGSIHFNSLELKGGSQSLGTSIPCVRSRRGTVVYISGEGSTPDQMFACLRASTGTFQWKSLVGTQGYSEEGGAGFGSGSGEGARLDGTTGAGGGFSGGGAGGGGAGGISKVFGVGGRHPIHEGQALSYVGGKVFPGIAVHVSEHLSFGAEDQDLMASQGIQGQRKKVGLYPLSKKRFLLSYCNSVGNIYLQLGRLTGSDGLAQSMGINLNKAKIVFSKGGKVDDIDLVMLGDDRFVAVYTEYQSGGRLMAVAAEVLRDDVVAFGVPIEVLPKGARFITATPMGSNRIAVLHTKMKHDPDAKKGGCLLILKHDPKFKHLDIFSNRYDPSNPKAKGDGSECIAKIGKVIDGVKLVYPTNDAANAQANIAKDVKLVALYRDLVTRNTVVQNIVVNEKDEHDLKLEYESTSASASVLSAAKAAAGGGGEGASGGNATSDSEATAAAKKDASPQSEVVVSRLEVVVTAPTAVHDYAARLKDVKLKVLTSTHVIVVYADQLASGILVLDVSGSRPFVTAGPTVFSNKRVLSLGIHIQNHKTVLVAYSFVEPIPLSSILKVEIDLNHNGGGSGLHLHDSVVTSSHVTHSEVVSVGSGDSFAYAFLFGYKQREEVHALGSGGVLAGGFGHIVGVAATDAEPESQVPVLLSGVSKHHKNLFPGQCYYATATGSLSVAPTSSPIGFAISDTELLLFAPSCTRMD